MVNENVDIALVLSTSAGKLLAEAYKLHKEMSENQSTSEKYFFLRAKEREACIQTVILFQASMEAMINEEIENEPKLKAIKKQSDELNSKFKILSFKNKWEQVFTILKISEKKKEYLLSYLKFYIKYRVPITHARSRYVDAEKFNFLNVYDGVKKGYLTVEAFYTSLSKFSKEHSWEEFKRRSILP